MLHDDHVCGCIEDFTIVGFGFAELVIGLSQLLGPLLDAQLELLVLFRLLTQLLG